MPGERPSGIVKRSVAIAGHRTSISLEEPFWAELALIARSRNSSVQALVAAIDAERGRANLSSAIRVFVLAAAKAGTDQPPDGES